MSDQTQNLINGPFNPQPRTAPALYCANSVYFPILAHIGPKLRPGIGSLLPLITQIAANGGKASHSLFEPPSYKEVSLNGEKILLVVPRPWSRFIGISSLSAVAASWTRRPVQLL